MYPVLISLIISLFVLTLLPRDRGAFEPLGFMSAASAAHSAEAEVHAHSLSVFTEAIMARLEDDPESLVLFPRPIGIADLRDNPYYQPVLPASYRPSLPWQAFVLPGNGIGEVGAVVAFINPGNLPPTVRPVDLARGLHLTAGRQVTVGLFHDGTLLTEGFTYPQVAHAFGAIHDIPDGGVIQDRAPMIVVCLDKRYCGGSV